MIHSIPFLLDLVEGAAVIRMGGPSNNLQIYINMYHIFPISFSHPPIPGYTTSLSLSLCWKTNHLSNNSSWLSSLRDLFTVNAFHSIAWFPWQGTEQHVDTTQLQAWRDATNFFFSTSGIFTPVASQPDKNNAYILLKYKHSKHDLLCKQTAGRD